VRRVALLALLLVFASSAAAAVQRGTNRSDTIVGSPAADQIVARAGNDFVQAAFGGVDRVDCGSGRDVVSADLGDKIASSCEVVSRRLSLDTYTNGDSQHETAVEPDSFANGSTVVAAFQIGRREGGAAANIGTAVSRNGGRTWTRSALRGTTPSSSPAGPEVGVSDPAVAWDAMHGVWLVTTLAVERSFTHIYVARSTDGVAWSAPVDAADGAVLDKEWTMCDNGAASPFRGRCYLEYSDDAANTTVSEYSTDGGLTWSGPTTAGSILVGTQPVIQPDGTLVVVAGDYKNEEALSGSIVALRSNDGGKTFTPSTVSDLQSANNDPMRAISLPSVEADSNGTLYATWADCRFRSGCSSNDLVLSTSTDGATWTSPARVTTGTDAFIPGLASDPAHPGRLAVVYAHFYGKCTKAPCVVGISLVQSRDGGKMWSAAQRLDAQPFSTNWLPRAEGGRMVGDYFSTSFAGGRVVPVFALAAAPLKSRFREAIFATSLQPVG
jgi:BNR repeat-like domain